ncbi:MAG TPA: CoA-acylating methylmalonate-semialdehyde dehydrogenase [Acidimicrobiales bacterium]|nr:CoA-acylating methylmalonate-semialdehyde dehydrogenase [Acidimicrobiales bacterium]
MDHVTHMINNKAWVGIAERQGEVHNPSTGEVTAMVDFATSNEIDLAVESASKAFSVWGTTSIAKRTEILFRYRELLNSRRHEVARRVSAEHGKVQNDALGEVSRGLEVVDFACGIGQLLKGEFSENVSTGVDSYSIRQPLGVVTGITPFNFPAMVPMWMFPVAIACGNTFILKPSEKDPSTSVFLAELLVEAGLPEGVFNVVHGDQVAVEALLDHPRIAAVSFVGSTAVARSIYERAAKAGKRVQALGGAKNHMVVMPDADMEVVADAAVNAGYGSAGERCMAISVIVAVGSAGELIIEKVRERVANLKVAPADDPDADMGPLITKEHRDRVAAYLDSGVDEGADLAIDGRQHKIHGDPGGYWLGPSLFDNVQPQMSLYRNEIFGPVLSMIRVTNLDEALELIGTNPYGNGAAIFTSDGSAARRFQAEVEAGMIGINLPIPVPVSYYSFGGWNQSLFGDLHIYGPDGVRFYTRAKAITARWTGITRNATLAFPTNS